MTQLPDAFDWARIQSFLAVAETGTLSAAARSLGLSQPTLGRQIRALEVELGVTLFTRKVRGLELTETGTALLEPARLMEQGARALALAAAGREEQVAGTVRITASQVMSHDVLPSILARLREEEPEIQIELSPSDTTQNLLFREADIALRMYRPDQLDMIARHVGDVPLGLFATQTYLDRVGTPKTIEEAIDCQIIGYDRDDRIIRGLRAYGLDVDRTDFPVRCDDQVIHWQLVRAGCGLGFAPLMVGEAEPGMRRLLPEAELPVLPCWLTTHEAMRRTPRIRRIWDGLCIALAEVLHPPTSQAGARSLGDLV